MAKAVNLYIDSLLPEDLQDPTRVYDKRGMGDLLREIGHRYPDRFAELSKKLQDAGRLASYQQGETLTLDDLRPVVDKPAILAQMDEELSQIEGLPKKEKKLERIKIFNRYAGILQQETLANATRLGTNLGNTVASGARGNPTQLAAMITSPGVYTDYKGDTIPLFVRHSYAEGLRPAEYLASTFGIRSAIISIKNATADAGDLGKQLEQAVSDQVVTVEDCGTQNGIDLPASNASMVGRVLAAPIAGLSAGTFIDQDVLSHIKDEVGEDEPILVRSALTCQAREGLCANCHGAMPGNTELPPLGYSAGRNSASSIKQPLAQGSLSAKHTAGAYEGEKKSWTGFDVVNQILQSPEVFPDKAAVAEEDGVVDKVETAEHGGHIVHIGDKRYYIPQGLTVNVAKGAKVSAGDVLSDGIVDVSDIMATKGLGEGRRFYSEYLHDILRDSGAATSLRNTEVIARGGINHVTVSPEGVSYLDDSIGRIGDYLPGDTARYNTIVTQYAPSATSKRMSTKSAVGKYLQQPILHYSIGTKVTPQMVDRVTKVLGDTEVTVDDTAPDFVPNMVRLRAASHSNPDWLARFESSYLKNTLQESAVRGRDTNVKSNVSISPRLGVGENFGVDVEKTGKF